MKNISIKVATVVSIAFAITTSCTNPNAKKEAGDGADTIRAKDTMPNPYINKTISVRTFQNDVAKDNLTGFGYNIYVDSAMTVHQPNVPAVPGNKGFSSAEEAQRIGEMVAYKVKHNIMPPSVSVHELDSLGVK